MAESRLEIDTFNRFHEIGHLLITLARGRCYDRLVHYSTGQWALDDLWDFFEEAEPTADASERRERDFDFLAIRAAAVHTERISDAYTEERSQAARKDDTAKFEKRLAAVYQRESASWPEDIRQAVSFDDFIKAVDDLLDGDLSHFFGNELVREVVRRVAEHLKASLKWDVGGYSASWQESQLTAAVAKIEREVEAELHQEAPELTSFPAFVRILDGSAWAPVEEDGQASP